MAMLVASGKLQYYLCVKMRYRINSREFVLNEHFDSNGP